MGAMAVLLAGFVQGCTGFGFALVSVPVLVLIFPPAMVPPIVVMLSMLSNVIVLIETRKWVRLRMVIPLLIGGVIGLPVGGYILSRIEPGPFKLIVGVLVFIFAIVMLAGWRRPVSNETAGLVPVGILSGVLSTSTSMGGPPLVLFFSNQGIEKEGFRANIVAYFMPDKLRGNHHIPSLWPARYADTQNRRHLYPHCPRRFGYRHLPRAQNQRPPVPQDRPRAGDDSRDYNCSD